MTTPIDKILRAKGFKKPDEIEIIKNFVAKEFNAKARVMIKPEAIFIGVENSALAGALRMSLPKLSRQLNTNKRLVIKIGGFKN